MLDLDITIQLGMQKSKLLRNLFWNTIYTLLDQKAG